METNPTETNSPANPAESFAGLRARIALAPVTPAQMLMLWRQIDEAVAVVEERLRGPLRAAGQPRRTDQA